MSGQAEYLIAAGAVLAAVILILVTAIAGLVYRSKAQHKRSDSRFRHL